MCHWHNFQSSKFDWLDESSKTCVIGTIFSPRNLIGWMSHQKICAIGTIFSPRNLIGWMSHQKYVSLAQFSVLEI